MQQLRKDSKSLKLEIEKKRDRLEKSALPIDVELDTDLLTILNSIDQRAVSSFIK